MSDHITRTQADGVLTLTLDRPAKKNALTDGMYAALTEALEAAQRDPEVRVVLLRAEGESFTAGNDLSEFAAVAMGGSMPQNVLRFLEQLARADKPLLAAVQGNAVGVGATLLLHCDYVVLADDARLSTPFVGLALVPEAASSSLLPARIGHLRAFSMFALGERVDAQTALSWGLCNQVVSREALTATATEVAQRLARQPLGALVATKRLMRQPEPTLAQMQRENEVFLQRLTTAEAREAFTAFAERRPADFSKLSG